MKSVSIVVPAYRPASLLKRCLDGIMHNTDMQQVEVIVVCNGSDIESAQLVLELGEPYRLVWYHDTIGFTRAANIGLRLAEYENVVLLNTDSFILDSHGKNVWLDKLLSPLDDATVGLTGLGFMGTKFGKFAPFFCVGIKNRTFQKVGYLDENFSPGYFEDADFCYRLVQAGYRLVQVDNPIPDPGYPGRTITDFPIWHLGEQSFTDKQKRKEYNDRNYELLCKKWEGVL